MSLLRNGAALAHVERAVKAEVESRARKRAGYQEICVSQNLDGLDESPRMTRLTKQP
jgi:hypothetical protein